MTTQELKLKIIQAVSETNNKEVLETLLKVIEGVSLDRNQVSSAALDQQNLAKLLLKGSNAPQASPDGVAEEDIEDLQRSINEIFGDFDQ